MDNKIWGPKLWHKLHTISFNYPNKPTEKDKENMYFYFSNLKNILPCDYCKVNYKKKLLMIQL